MTKRWSRYEGWMVTQAKENSNDNSPSAPAARDVPTVPSISRRRNARRSISLCSLDDLVGSDEEGLRNRQAESFRGLEVDDQLEFGGLLDGKVGGLGALEDLVHVNCGLLEDVGKARSVGHQPPELYCLPIWEHAWQSSTGRKVHNETSIGIAGRTFPNKEGIGPGAVDHRESVDVLMGPVFSQEHRHTQSPRRRPNALPKWAIPLVVFLAPEIGDSRDSRQSISQEL